MGRRSRSVLERTILSLRDRGVLVSLAIAAEEVVGTLVHGRRTGGTVPVERLDGDPEHHALETVRFRTLRRTLAAIPDDCCHGFLDLGCGHGRVLVAASSAGFSPVIGVELSARVAARARRATVPHAVEVVDGDAADYEIPSLVTAIYMGNPFGETTLHRVLDQVDASQARRPRPMAIAYANPVDVAVVEARGFRAVWVDPDSVVLRRDP